MTREKYIIGAIAGDIIGSAYKFNNVKSVRFELFNNGTYFTDDSVLTIACITGGIAEAFYKEVPTDITDFVSVLLGPRSEPPMPICTAVVNFLPPSPLIVPARTSSANFEKRACCSV
jgi:hypothetical protein